MIKINFTYQSVRRQFGFPDGTESFLDVVGLRCVVPGRRCAVREALDPSSWVAKEDSYVEKGMTQEPEKRHAGQQAQPGGVEEEETVARVPAPFPDTAR